MVLSKVNLDLLSSLFLRDVPQRGEDMMAFCFKIEKAWWFYADKRGSHGLQDDGWLGFNRFAKELFARVPALSPHAKNAKNIISAWKRHAFTIPRYGCVILDDTNRKVLLVKGRWGNSSWCFPRGKIEGSEEPHRCALREVEEEIGLDFTSLIDPNNFLEDTQNGQFQRLYVISGVSEETALSIRNRQEISQARWFDIAGLPAFERDPAPVLAFGLSWKKFRFLVPFVRRIRGLVSALPPLGASITETRRKTSISLLPPKFSEIIDALRQLPLRLGKPSGGVDLRPPCSWVSGK